MATGYPTQVIMGTLTTGTLTNTTPVVVDLLNKPIPCTISLKSAAVGRLVRFSANGVAAADWFTPEYDLTDVNKIIVVLTTPMSKIEFTGQSGDVWSIQ